jgi:hypothetical protein
MVDDDEDEELTEEDRRAIQVGLDSLEKHGTFSMEEVLADFGLTMADFEKMAHEPDPLPATKLNGSITELVSTTSFRSQNPALFK